MYNIKSVSKLLDMPAVTIRAWERRYNVVSPTRSESGHRLYSEQDIEDLRWLKVQTEEKGINISQAVKMLEKLREQRTDKPRQEASKVILQGYEEVRATLYEALTSLDAMRANAVIDMGFSMFHYEDMFHQVLAPILQQIGDEWETGLVSVAQEHFASQLIYQRLSQFFRVFPVNPAMPRVLAFCPEGEEHQLGLLLFQLFLRKNGADVINLGANTPRDGLAEIIERQNVKVVAVSLTDAERLVETERLLRDLAGRFPEVKFVIGGQGFAGVADDLETWRVEGGVVEWEQWYRDELLNAKRG
jgi:MerR family transcriptional regulator, light-induced transcriptional regulator